MTDEQRQAAWDRVAAEMQAFETADLRAENASGAIAVLCVIAAVAVAAWAIWIF